jgi:glycosyltransferase involved in cell wall biosynthesis
VGGQHLTQLHPNITVTSVPAKQGYYAYGALGLVHAFSYLLSAWRTVARRRKAGEHYDALGSFFSLEAFLMRFLRCFYEIPYALVLGGDTPLEIIEGKRANACSHISNFMAEQSRKHGYDTWLLPKGIDTERFRPGVFVRELRTQLAPAGEKIVLTVCRLDPRKNLSTLIRAAALVRDRNKVNCRFVLVGDGVERAMLEQEVRALGLQDQFVFIGAVPNNSPLLPEYYNAADLFALPTLYEGFGWVFQEAMACGLPILTTNAGSNPEVVGGVGVMVPIKSPERLADEIESLLLDPKRMTEMRGRGLDRIKQFEWGSLLPKYEEFFSSVASVNLPGFSARLHDLLVGLLQDGWLIFRWVLFGGVVFNIGKRRREFKAGGQEGNRASQTEINPQPSTASNKE